MTRVKKPCPGCKTTDYTRPSPDDVCQRCQQRLKVAVTIDEWRARNEASGSIVVSTTERHYSLPNLHHYCRDLSSEGADALKKAFHNLITINQEQQLLSDYSDKTPVQVPPFDRGERMDWSVIMVMPKKQAEAINALWTTVCTVIGGISDEAFERGRNLLLGVASGEVTVNKLNEATTRKRT